MMTKKTLLTFFGLTLIAIMINSCKKDLYEPPETVNKANDETIASLKQQFYLKNYQQKLGIKLDDTLSIQWNVDWNIYSKSEIGDSLIYYSFQLNPSLYNSKTNKPFNTLVKEFNIRKVLLIGKTANSTFYRIATYFAESKITKKKITENNIDNSSGGFSGNVVYNNLDINTTNQQYYLKGNKIANPMANKRVITNSNGTNTVTYDCYNLVSCYFTARCDNGVVITAVTGRDFCPPTPTYIPNMCEYYFDRWTYSYTDTKIVCDPVEYPDTPPITTPVTPPYGGIGTVPGLPQVDDPTKKPCPGDPIKLTRVAPSNYLNINGGRFGDARRTFNNTVRHHYGLDIAALPNTPLYPIMSGVVVSINTSVPPGSYVNERSFGNFIIVQSTLPSGEVIKILYGHLNSLKPNLTWGSTVTVGTAMGLTGQTGNAAAKGVHFPHVHIQATINGVKVNVEPYVRTKFDPSGAAIVSPC